MHEKKIYIIHHGKAEDNDFDCSLTSEGREKVENMVVSLLQTEEIKTCKIMSSEYKRAVETAEIFDKHLNLGFCKDSRLNEINIGSSKENLKEELKKRFECVNSKFEGGESIQQVMERTHQVIRDIINENNKNNYILVTHRITTLLLLHYFDKQFGFDKTWEIASPDAYLIKISEERFKVEHIKI
ncbi:TPA: histidine phosphatase family protein [Bacillus cereus]|nr:histidine phosphatase family protein [Bacillus cereus]